MISDLYDEVLNHMDKRGLVNHLNTTPYSPLKWCYGENGSFKPAPKTISDLYWLGFSYDYNGYPLTIQSKDGFAWSV